MQFLRLRTRHYKQLADYRYCIDKEEDDACTECSLNVPETLEHVLCICPAMNQARSQQDNTTVTLQMMTSDLE